MGRGCGSRVGRGRVAGGSRVGRGWVAGRDDDDKNPHRGTPRQPRTQGRCKTVRPPHSDDTVYMYDGGDHVSNDGHYNSDDGTGINTSVDKLVIEPTMMMTTTMMAMTMTMTTTSSNHLLYHLGPTRYIYIYCR